MTSFLREAVIHQFLEKSVCKIRNGHHFPKKEQRTSAYLRFSDRYIATLKKRIDLEKTRAKQQEEHIVLKTSVSPSWLSKPFGISKHSRLTFDGHLLIIFPRKSVPVEVHIKDIDNFNTLDGIIWDAFEIILRNGQQHLIDGLPKAGIETFAANFRDAFTKHYYAYQYKKAEEVRLRLPKHDQYFQTRHLNELKDFTRLKMADFRLLSRPPKKREHKELFNFILKLQNNDDSWQTEHNDQFIKQELQTYKSFFDDVEKNPLKLKQREAVVINEESNLVVAGAGSGKTSVMVARVGYVMKKYGLKSEEILLLAFNKTAAKELQNRIKEMLGIEKIKASTFHSLGLEIIGKTESAKASVASWAADDIEKAELIETLIMETAQKDPEFKETLLHFFAYPFSVYKSEFEFASKMEYSQYIRENRIITLKGEQVRSYEECEIANFFFLNQMEYQYEPHYKHPTASAEYSQYQPDFYLSDHDIYLEHFGIDEQGNTAPYIDKRQYLEGMVWKRALHRHHGTKLLETYSYQKSRGCLLLKLREMLEKENVTLGFISLEDALAGLNQKGLVNSFAKTVSTFIGHYKGNDHRMGTIRDRAGSDERLNAFLDVFEPVLRAYEATKTSQGVIDFEDMILRAANHVESREYSSPFKCILVDEYQDISTARACLVRALHRQVKGSVLTVVGDDWQSIYRFAGSDVSLFHNFKEFFGESRHVKLDYTFRFNNNISDVSQKFIEKNPNQIKKEIKTLITVDVPAINMWWGDDKDMERIEMLLSAFSSHNGPEPFSVFILGRTRYSFPDNIYRLKRRFPHIKIKTITAHSSKGLEADYVIIVGLSSGRFGFPSTVEDDPILDIVLAESEHFEHAEERRLFYVAMTRAKREVHILASNSEISPFAKELQEKEYKIQHHYKDNFKPRPCPACGFGTLIVRSGRNGRFLACSNFATLGCEHTEPINYCQKCKSGIMQYDEKLSMNTCSNDACGNKERACPQCKGILAIKFSDGREFIGCSNFHTKGCRYTEPVRQDNNYQKKD